MAIFATADSIPEPSPPWTEVAEHRYVFAMPADLRFCMVRIPAAPGAGEQPFANVSAVSHSSPPASIPLRVIHADRRELVLMLDANLVKPETEVAIYAAAGETPVAPSGSGPLDPAPLLGEVRRVAGQDYPLSMAEHLFQRRRMRRPAQSFRAVSFEHAARESDPEKRRREWTRAAYCLDLHTWIRIPRAGKYRFAVKGANSVFLLLGRERTPVVEAAGGARLNDDDPGDKAWVTGPEIHLEAGVLQLQLAQISRNFANASIGWVPPGETEPAPLPPELMLSGNLLPEPRAESIHAVVHAGFDYRVGRAYRFAGTDTVFAPARLKSYSSNWMKGPASTTWWLDGVELGDDKSIAPVLTAGTHRIGLAIRNRLGFESRVERDVFVPDFPAVEYRLAGSLQGIPAICYPRDRFRPDLWVRGTLPEQIPVQAEIVARMRDGRTERHSSDVNLTRDWGNLPAPEYAAGDLAEIAWRISHGGADLARETVRFVAAPFSTLPDRASGDELRSGAERLILVPNKEGRRKHGRAAHATLVGGASSPPAGEPPRRIVFLDSTLSPRGVNSAETWLANFSRAFAETARADTAGAPRAQPETIHLDYETLGGGGEELRTLAPLAALQDFGKGDLVVLSLGLEAYAEREPVASFERRLAALCGLLSEAAAAEVVLVTPPPFEGRAAEVRPYAEAVLRVADSRGCRAADLFSAFVGHPDGDGLYRELRLTPEGRALAAKLVAAAVARTPDSGGGARRDKGEGSIPPPGHRRLTSGKTIADRTNH